MNCVVRYTDTFFKSLDMVTDHLLFYNNQNPDVINKVEIAVKNVKEVVLKHPRAYPINQDLLEYGLSYREANIDDEFRVFYSISEEASICTIDFELFLQQKMSCQKALVDFCLLL